MTKQSGRGSLGGCLEIVGSLIAMLIAGTLVRACMRIDNPSMPANSTPDKAALIQEISTEANKQLPQMIDRVTRLDSTSAGPGDQLSYNYTLTNLPSDRADLSGFNALSQDLTRKVCASSDMQRILSLGVTIIYVYRGNDGREIGRVPIHSSTCSSQSNNLQSNASDKFDASKSRSQSQQVQPSMDSSALPHRSDNEWRRVISDATLSHMSGITNSPYIYYLTEESAPDFVRQHANFAKKIPNDLARGILPGNLVVYASPASQRMASTVADAYSTAERNSMPGVRVLFIGLPSDNNTVARAVLPTGADYVFADISNLD